MAQSNIFEGRTREVSRKVPIRRPSDATTVSRVKQYFGYRPGSRYSSIREKISPRLRKYVKGEPSENEIRDLFNLLAKSPPDTWKSVRDRVRSSSATARVREQGPSESVARSRAARDARAIARQARRDATPPGQLNVSSFKIRGESSPAFWLRNVILKNLGRVILVEGLNGRPGLVAQLGVEIGIDLINVNQARGAIVVRYTDESLDKVVHEFERDMGTYMAELHKDPDAIKASRVYDIPSDRGKAMAMFRDSWFYHWVFTYPHPGVRPGLPINLLEEGDTVRVVRMDSVRAAENLREQRFAHGPAHCLIQPLLSCAKSKVDMLTEQLDEADKKKKASIRCQRSRFSKMCKILEEFAVRFADGIPESEISTLVNEVSKSMPINIIINLPLNVDRPLLEYRNATGHGRTYHFVNTRWDHVDLNRLSIRNIQNMGRGQKFEPNQVSESDIGNIISEHNKHGQHIEWQVSSTNEYLRAWSMTEAWVVKSQIGDDMANLADSTKINRLRISHTNEPDLSEFIRGGTHFNAHCTLGAEKSQNIGLIDIRKSYATFHTCVYYDECKFPNKITHLAPCDKIMGPGLYLIDNIDWSNASPKFVEIEKHLSSIKNNNIYAVPILRCMQDHGVKFNIVMGCWAGGRDNTFDFRFPQEMITNKNYAFAVGMMHSLITHTRVVMYGTRQMAEHIQAHCFGASARWIPPLEYAEGAMVDGTIHLCYKKKNVTHLSQITAYINAYEYTRIVQQLMKMDLDKVIQVNKDDIMYNEHQFELMPYMSSKTHELTPEKLRNKLMKRDGFHKLNESMDKLRYMSNVPICELASNAIDNVFYRQERFNERFPDIGCVHAPVVMHQGPGGTGKTDHALRDPMRIGCCYVAPTYALQREKAGEYGHDLTDDAQLEKAEMGNYIPNITKISTTLWTRLCHDSPAIWNSIDLNCNTIVIDEVSMMSDAQKQFIIDRYPNHAIVFAGDVQYQLGIFDRVNRGIREFSFDYKVDGRKISMPVIQFTKVHRVKCEKLREIRHAGRLMITEALRAYDELGRLFNGSKQQYSEQLRIQQSSYISQMTDYYMKSFRVINTVDELESLYEPFDIVDGKYKSKDLIIGCTNRVCDRWTDHLMAKMPTLAGQRVQKYRIESTSREYSNGDIVVSIGPPENCKSVVAHAFTAHATIGKTARGKIFIDAASMFDLTHWETIVGRASRWEDIYILDVQPEECKYSNTTIYRIYNKTESYIGHTTTDIDTYIKRKKRDKKCMSKLIFSKPNSKWEVLEKYPCESIEMAEAREAYWITQYPDSINKNLVHKDKFSHKGVVTLDEPINREKLTSILEYIEKRMHLLKPEGQDKAHDKVRLVRAHLTKLKDEHRGRVSYGYRGAAPIGRLYASDTNGNDKTSASLQGAFKGTRAALMGHIAHDVDIENSLPTITVQWMDKVVEKGLLGVSKDDYIWYSHYTRERAMWIDGTMEYYGCTRDVAKTLILIAVHGGDPRHHYRDLGVEQKELYLPIRMLIEECVILRHKIIPAMIEQDEYRLIYEAKRRVKNHEDAMKSVWAIITHQMEDIIMGIIREYVNAKGIQIYSLIHDGMLISQCSDELLREIEEEVALYGWTIRLSEKPMYGLQDEPIPELEPLLNN